MKTFCILLFILLAACNVSAAADVSVLELITHTQKYDGSSVSCEGEVVGDIMLRGKNAWLNMRDTGGAIGIFCPRELAAGITYKGSYDFIGDRVLVQGVFHNACALHGGDTDIHAERITVIRKGESVSHPLEPRKVRTGIILSAITILFLIGYLVTRRFR